MGGTILPPTQREIESENRQLKYKLDEVYLSISKIVNGSVRPDKVTFERLKEIIEYIYPTKLEPVIQPMSESAIEAWRTCLKYAPK